MKQGYVGEFLGPISLALTATLSRTRISQLSNPIGWYITGVAFLVNMDQILKHNALADIHTKYNASKHTQGVFSIGNMSRSNYSINYYDAKTGNYLGVINYSLGGGSR